MDWAGVVTAVAVGSFSSAVLVANNLRDIPTDTESGKRTLAVRLGDARTRILHLVTLTVPFIATLVLLARTPGRFSDYWPCPLRSGRTRRFVPVPQAWP